MEETNKDTISRQPTVRLFLISSISFFLITTIIGLMVAIKFVWPEFMGNMAWMTFGRMRPLHINGVLFGWLLAADMGLLYWLVPRICGNKLWSEKLGIATGIIWNSVILGAIYTTLSGHTQGLEYAELPFLLDVMVTVAWVMFGK